MNKTTGINLVIILFTLAFIFLCYASVQDYFLKKNGVKTMGIVSDVSILTFPLRSRYNQTTPIVSYMTKDGKMFRVNDCDSCHKVGEYVPVIYDSQHPENAIIDTKSSNAIGIYYLIGYLLIVIFYVRLKKRIAQS